MAMINQDDPNGGSTNTLPPLYGTNPNPSQPSPITTPDRFGRYPGDPQYGKDPNGNLLPAAPGSLGAPYIYPNQPSPTTTPTTPNPSAAGAGGAPTLNRNDPGSVSAFIKYYSTQPGADPSLANDPNYWAGKISSGELGDDPNYIIQKMMTAYKGGSGGGGFNSAGAVDPSVWTTPFNEPFSFPTPQQIPNYAPPSYVSAPQAPDPVTIGLPPGVTPNTPTTGSIGTSAASGSSPYNLPAPPQFSFNAPTPQEAMNDPGYSFRTKQGQQAIQNAAAARGVLNSGGTLADLINYSQDAASQEYNNVWNRAFNTAQQRYSAELAPWQTQAGVVEQNVAAANQLKNAGYQAQVSGAQQQNSLNSAGSINQYNVQSAAIQHLNDMAAQQAWEKYLQDYQAWRNFSNDTWNRTYSAVTA